MLFQNILLPLEDQEKGTKRLLILSCSERKVETREDLPAIERYDGPLWRVLRSFLLRTSSTDLDIYVLSAEFGLIPADRLVPLYERKMTKERAKELHESTICQFKEIMKSRYTQLCLSLSQLYFNALLGWEQIVPLTIDITITDGTLTTKQSQLKSWLAEQQWEPTRYLPHQQITAKASHQVVVLNSVTIHLSKEEILEKARQALAAGVEGSDRYKDWYILLDDRPIAPKWLVSLISGVCVNKFDASRARNVLLSLGIDIIRAH